MELRSGIDLIEIDRLEGIAEKTRERFLKRVFTASELAEAGGLNHHLAGKFAAKEAVAKALGCGIGAVGWKEIEILSDEAGAPSLFLHGKAAEQAKNQHLTGWSVSISHSRTQAAALAVAIALKTPAGQENFEP